MKKTLLYLVSVLMLFACGGDDGGGSAPTGSNEYLNASNVDIPGGNTTATLYINASQNCDWIITWSESWIRSINPTKGRGNQNATITVSPNPSSTATRTAIIKVSNTSGTIVRDVTVSQSPNAESLELSMTTMNFTNVAGSQDVTITSNTHWTITGSASWLTLNKTEGDNNGSVRITVEANTAKSEREVVLTFTGSGGISKQLTVRQQGDTSTDFRVSTTELSANAPAGTVQFNIIGDAQWTISSNKSWATTNTTYGEGNANIIVTLTDNTSEESREAVITVSSNTKSETVIIRQSAGTKPTITGLNVNYDNKNSAVVSFSYSSMFPVTEYGVCYNTSGQPTINDAHQSESGSTTQGSPSITLTGLAYSATYYVRAYAKSAVGIQYSEAVSFTTANDRPGSDDNVTPGI